jgi:hypothetical protein
MAQPLRMGFGPISDTSCRWRIRPEYTVVCSAQHPLQTSDLGAVRGRRASPPHPEGTCTTVFLADKNQVVLEKNVKHVRDAVVMCKLSDAAVLVQRIKPVLDEMRCNIRKVKKLL